MTGVPGIAVVIVNWNAGAMLDQCLAALERQTLRPRRTIVVDNASADGSLAGLADRHPGVEVVRLDANTGFAAATNLGVARVAECEWLALLNPDAFPEPGWLAALARAAREHPEAASFASRLVSGRHDGLLDGTGDVYHVSGAAWRREHGRAPSPQTDVADEIFAPSAAAALYSREAFVAAGGFDERFFCYFEDVDLGFRLRLRGHRARYVPGAVVRHVGSALMGEQSPFYGYYGHRNGVWTYFRNMPGALLWLYLPQHLIWNVATILRYALLGQAGNIVKAKWDGFRALPRLWRERRAIQAARTVSARQIRRAMATGWRTPYFRRGPAA